MAKYSAARWYFPFALSPPANLIIIAVESRDSSRTQITNKLHEPVDHHDSSRVVITNKHREPKSLWLVPKSNYHGIKQT